MSLLLRGKEVSDKITALSLEELQELRKKDRVLQMATVRIGNREADAAYERMIAKRCQSLGIQHQSVVLPEDIGQDAFINQIEELNRDDQVNGVLLFRPFPKGMDEDRVRNSLKEEKDIDGITDASLAGVFTGTDRGFPPCTAQAVMEMLKYYGVELQGKNITVLGRSLVVGKPLAMMLLKENATVRICHSASKDYTESLKHADIVISCIGKPKFLKEEYFASHQIIIDVGINTDRDGNLCGDVDFEKCNQKVKAVTPVPGGVGSVTTAVLIRHLIMTVKKGPV